MEGPCDRASIKPMKGVREEVAWNGYSNTEEGPALFFGRQPGRAAPDERN